MYCAWNYSSLTQWKTILKWNIFVCLKQFIAFWKAIRKWNISRSACLEQFIVFEKRSWNGIFWRACNNLSRRKATLKWNCVVRLEQFIVFEKRSSSGIFLCTWNNSCMIHWKSILKSLVEIRGAPGTIHRFEVLLSAPTSPETILVWKAILKLKLRDVPGKIYVWKTTLKWNIFARPEQFVLRWQPVTVLEIFN